MSDWVVDIQDFQSIKKGTVTISSGLNIVTGPTNRGKTGIIRAIDCALFNKGTDDLVRVGASIFGVTISNEKHSMTYCRNIKGKNEKSAYQLDGGTVQRKVGRTQLPEVKDMFGVTDIRMKNDITMKLNFWYQNDKPFLMDKTAGQLYEFISLSSADKYVKVLKQMATDIKIQEAEINNATTTIDTLKVVNNRKQDFVDKNDGFDIIYSEIVTADSECKKLNETLRRIEILESLRIQMDEVLHKLSSINEKYSKVPIQDISDNYLKLQESNSVYLKLYQLLYNVSSSRKSMNRISELLLGISSQYSSSLSIFESTEQPMRFVMTSSSEISSITDKMLRLQGISISIQDIRKRIDELGTYDESDIQNMKDKVVKIELSEKTVLELKLAVTNLTTLEKKVQDIHTKISEVQKESENTESELDSFKNEVGYCPFCGSVFCKENH